MMYGHYVENIGIIPRLVCHVVATVFTPISAVGIGVYKLSNMIGLGAIFNYKRRSIVPRHIRLNRSIKIGNFTIIDKDVSIGNNVTIGDFVKLTAGTVIHDGCRIDDYVTTSGYCEIGRNVTVKRCTMIGQACKIYDNAWIGSHVTTTRVKYPGNILESPTEEEWVTIGEKAVIGSSSLLMAGVSIGNGAIVGSGAVIAEDCVPGGIYMGQKAELYRIRSGFKDKEQ
jgi:acetyltransferase-like isoleucine patch superfamily enzyme